MGTLFLIAFMVFSSTRANDGNSSMHVRLYPEVGLALVPASHTLVKMTTERVQMTVNFRIKNPGPMKTEACFNDDSGHLDTLLSMTIMDQLEQELQPFDLVTRIKSLLPNVTMETAISNVNSIEMDTSSWSRAYEKAILERSRGSVGDEAWKPEKMSTSTMATSTTSKSSTVFTSALTKTTAQVTQKSWDGPFYPEEPEFREAYGEAEDDYDDLQYGDALQGVCCSNMECDCSTVATEEDFSLKIYKIVSSIEVAVIGLGSDVQVEVVEDGADTVVVLDAENGSLVFRAQDLVVIDAFATRNTLVVQVDTFLRYLHASVMVIQCKECGTEAEVRILKRQGRWKRSVASWLFDLESRSDFERVMANFKQQQSVWMKKMDVQEDSDRVSIENLRIHEEAVSTDLVHLHDEICQMKEAEMQKIRALVMGNHSRRLVQRVMAVVSSCSYGHVVPKEVMSKDKWVKLCQAAYINCNGDFLNGFISEITCEVNGLVLTKDDLVLDIQLRVPLGPRVSYTAERVVTVPIFSNSTIRVFKAEQESILIRTESGHTTVIDNCKKKSRWSTCNIEDSSEHKTACVGDAVGNHKVREGCFEIVPRRDHKSQCRVSQTPYGLLISTESKLRTSSTMLNLNGFSSDQGSKVIQPGVSFIAHQVDDTVRITCQGMQVQTQHVGEPIFVVKEDLTDSDAILVKEASNSTEWKDLSMDGILTRLSKSMDRMYSDPTVKPIFTKTRSHIILGVSTVIVIIFGIGLVACCCAQRINNCLQCFKSVFCCQCPGRQRQEDLEFNQGHRLSTIVRRSNQV